MPLEFTFNPFALISLFTVALVCALIAYIARQTYQTAILRWLVAVMAVILLWATSEFFIRISATVQTAIIFKYWEIAGYILIGPTAVGLSLAYVRKEKFLSQIKWLALLFLPACVFIYAAWTQNAFVNFSDYILWHQAWYGDWVAPLSPFFTLYFIPWLNILLIFAIFQLASYYRSQTSKLRKRQTRILIFGVIAPAIIGLITDQLFSTLTGADGLELATLMTGFSGLWVTYGIINYRLFEVNPAVIAPNILSVMPEVVIVCTPNWEIEYTNQPATEMFGFEPGQMHGQSIQNYIADGWKELQAVIQASESDRDSVEVTMKNNQGQNIPVGITPTVYYGASKNDVLAYVLMVVDLRQLRELIDVTDERNKLQATLSSISDGIIGIKSDAMISFSNHAALSMFGLTEYQVENTSFDSLFTLHTPIGTMTAQGLLDSAKENTQQLYTNITVITKNAQPTEINLIVSKLPQESSVDLAAILTIRNISKERQLERMKSNFTYLAAHELRTPLTSIRGYLHLLKAETSGLAKAHQSVLDRAISSTEQLSSLVSRLLEVSQIEQRELKLEKAVVTWSDVIVRIRDMYSPMAKSDKWHLTVQEPAQQCLVEVDQKRIIQVFSIILDNAIKYSEGIPDITISTEIQQDQVVTRIIDQGRGMSEELLEQLFTPFTRVDTGLTQTQQGVGLNLFIAKQLLSLHGGTIAVQSTPHHGSTFTITIPTINTTPSLPSLQ